MALVVTRVGGAREVVPDLLIWLLHKAIGHPLADLRQHPTITGKPGIYWWCGTCGADRLLPAKGKE